MNYYNVYRMNETEHKILKYWKDLGNDIQYPAPIPDKIRITKTNGTIINYEKLRDSREGEKEVFFDRIFGIGITDMKEIDAHNLRKKQKEDEHRRLLEGVSDVRRIKKKN